MIQAIHARVIVPLRTIYAHNHDTNNTSCEINDTKTAGKRHKESRQGNTHHAPPHTEMRCKSSETMVRAAARDGVDRPTSGDSPALLMASVRTGVAKAEARAGDKPLAAAVGGTRSVAVAAGADIGSCATTAGASAGVVDAADSHSVCVAVAAVAGATRFAADTGTSSPDTGRTGDEDTDDDNAAATASAGRLRSISSSDLASEPNPQANVELNAR